MPERAAKQGGGLQQPEYFCVPKRCWTRCCPNGREATRQCGPFHNASAEPGCDPSCDQHGAQMEVFASVKAAAKQAGRRSPHCMLYVNADYVWPFDAVSALRDDVWLLDVRGRPHVETCDPGLFPSYLWDYTKNSSRAAFLGMVARALRGPADGLYVDCYINSRLRCYPEGSTNCVTVGNGTSIHQPMANNVVSPRQAAGWMPEKEATMRKAAAMTAALGGSFFSKLAPSDMPPPYGGTMTWIWLCTMHLWEHVWREQGCYTAGCPVATPPYLARQIRAALSNYGSVIVGTDAELPTAGPSRWGTGFQSFCGDTAIALFLLALEPGAFLLCQGWDERFGLPLGAPSGPATLHPGTGIWSRSFEHGTNVTWENATDGAGRWRVETSIVWASP